MAATGNKFKYKVVNGHSAAYILALLSGNLKVTKANVTQSGTTPFAVSAVTLTEDNPANLVAYGIPADAVLADGTVATALVCSAANSQYKIDHFKNYIKNNPQYMTKLIIEASNSDVFQETLFIRQDNPLNGTPLRSINLSDYLGTMQNIDTKVEIPLGNLPITDETIMYMNIPAGRTITMTYELTPISG